MLTLTLKRILGVICLLLGLAALFTPLTPGSWLALVGIELLGLTFLLPHPVRSRWEKFKLELHRKWKAWWLRWKTRKEGAAAARVSTPHAGGRGL